MHILHLLWAQLSLPQKLCRVFHDVPPKVSPDEPSRRQPDLRVLLVICVPRVLERLLVVIEPHRFRDVLTAHVDEDIEFRVDFRVTSPDNNRVGLCAEPGAVEQHCARENLIRVEGVRVRPNHVTLMLLQSSIQLLSVLAADHLQRWGDPRHKTQVVVHRRREKVS